MYLALEKLHSLADSPVYRNTNRLYTDLSLLITLSRRLLVCGGPGWGEGECVGSQIVCQQWQRRKRWDFFTFLFFLIFHKIAWHSRKVSGTFCYWPESNFSIVIIRNSKITNVCYCLYHKSYLRRWQTWELSWLLFCACQVNPEIRERPIST